MKSSQDACELDMNMSHHGSLFRQNTKLDGCDNGEHDQVSCRWLCLHSVCQAMWYCHLCYPSPVQLCRASIIAPVYLCCFWRFVLTWSLGIAACGFFIERTQLTVECSLDRGFSTDMILMDFVHFCFHHQMVLIFWSLVLNNLPRFIDSIVWFVMGLVLYK